MKWRVCQVGGAALFSGVARAVLVLCCMEVSEEIGRQHFPERDVNLLEGKAFFLQGLCWFVSPVDSLLNKYKLIIMSTSLFGEDVRLLPPTEQVSLSICLLGAVSGVWKH